MKKMTRNHLLKSMCLSSALMLGLTTVPYNVFAEELTEETDEVQEPEGSPREKGEVQETEVEQSETEKTGDSEESGELQMSEEQKSTAQKSSEPSTSSQPFSVLHTNDMHGRLEPSDRTVDLSKLKTFADEKQPTLILDAGDAFQGLPISNFTSGKDMALVMNEIGYDAMAVGNHEFDFGFDTAVNYQEILDFPILSANIYKDDQLVFEPSTIVQKDDLTFGIIGLTSPETSTKTHPKNIEGVEFGDPIPIAKELTEQLKDEVDQMIYLVHLGVDESTQAEWRSDVLAEQLAEEYPDLPMLVIDGHSHTALEGGRQFGHVELVQTGGELQNVGYVESTVDSENIRRYNSTLFGPAAFEDYEQDSAVIQIIEGAVSHFETENSEVLYNDSSITFNGERENVRTKETNLGNLISDAMYIYGQDGFKNPTDFSMVNGGGIRASIKPGDITKGDVISVLPFGNIISQIAVTGDQVYEMFEHSLRADVQTDDEGNPLLDNNNRYQLGANGGFLQISRSVRVYFDATKAGANPEEEKAGERILGIEIYDRDADKFLPVDRERTYYMATNDFLAQGGDGYTMLSGEREEGPSLDQVFMDLLSELNEIHLVEDGFFALDLSQYTEELPSTRVLQMTEEEYLALKNPSEELFDQKIEELKNQISKLEEQLTVLKEQQAANREKIAQLENRISELEKQLAKLEDTKKEVSTNKIVSPVESSKKDEVKQESSSEDENTGKVAENKKGLPTTGAAVASGLLGSLALIAGASAMAFSKKRK